MVVYVGVYVAVSVGEYVVVSFCIHPHTSSTPLTFTTTKNIHVYCHVIPRVDAESMGSNVER